MNNISFVLRSIIININGLFIFIIIDRIGFEFNATPAPTSVTVAAAALVPSSLFSI
jgi:hypothetical protein